MIGSINYLWQLIDFELMIPHDESCFRKMDKYLFRSIHSFHRFQLFIQLIDDYRTPTICQILGQALIIQ